MENRGGEVHLDTEEARAGSTPHVVRWVLIVSLLLVIAFLSLTWITGAMSARETEHNSGIAAAISDVRPSPSPAE
jgi:hypothetical protein